MLLRSREKTFVRFCIVLLVVVEVTFIILVYTIAGVQKTIKYPEIFISDTLKEDPGRAIGAYLISFSAFLVVIIVGMRINRIEPLLRVKRDRLLWLAAIFFLIGVFLGRTGVAAVTLNTNLYLHSVAAATLYISSVLLFTVLTILDESVGLDRSPNVRQMEISVCASLWVLGFVFALTVGWLDQAAVVAELLLSGSILNYISLYYVETEFYMKSTFGPLEPDPDFFADTPPIGTSFSPLHESYLTHIRDTYPRRVCGKYSKGYSIHIDM